MEINQAFTFVFRGPGWKRKLLLLALCALLPAVAGLVAALVAGGSQPTGDPLLDLSLSFAPGVATVPIYGYVIRITRAVIAGDGESLPRWSDPRDLLRDGLKLWGVTAVWGLPLTLAGLAPGDGDPGAVFLGLLAGLLLAFISPAAEARLAATGVFRDGLDAGAAFGTVRRGLGDYGLILLIFAVGYGAAFALGAGIARIGFRLGGSPSGPLGAGDIGTALATVLFLPYFSCAVYHLYGQAYERANGSSTALSERGWDRST